jgi:hypothetical protein
MSEKKYSISYPDYEDEDFKPVDDLVIITDGDKVITASSAEIYHALQAQRREVVVGESEIITFDSDVPRFKNGTCLQMAGNDDKHCPFFFVDNSNHFHCRLNLFYHDDKGHGYAAPSDKCPGAGSYELILRKKGE